LLFIGLPPISANATNTFASLAGYLSGAYAFRDDLYAHRKALPQFILLSLIGGISGAWLLLRTPETLFREAIPWLLLFSIFLFAFGQKVNSFFKRLAAEQRHASYLGHILLFLLLLGVSVYGGFFNAGLGIITLSYLALAGYTNINAMNGIKLLISSVVSLIAIALFMYNSLISWHEGVIVLIGTWMGGYVAARISKHLSQKHVRAFVILASCGITAYFFIDTYMK